MTGSPAPGPGPLSGAAERIRQMLVTAESVAEDIRREATEEAERYLAERRREADALVAARRQRFEHALERLRSATTALEGALEGAEDEQPHQPAHPAAAPSPAPQEREPAPAADGSHVRQRALIRATQLAVQGAERRVVQETLEREFELDDAGPIVDEILGS